MSHDGFQELQDKLSKALVDVTRTAGSLANEDLAFHRSLTPSLNKTLDRQGDRLLSLARKLTNAAATSTNLAQPRLTDAESVDDEWKKVVDVIDGILEKADESLDQHTGIIKKKVVGQSDAPEESTLPSRKRLDRAFRYVNIEKPQLQFDHPPNNDSTEPFRPLLKSKPNALVPLEESLKTGLSEEGLTIYRNPYEHEIKEAQVPDTLKAKCEPIMYRPFDATSAIWVDTPKAVHDMLKILKTAEEIAVDLEHHDEHSYIGLVSLMQISTRDQDWVVDTLRPWRQDLQVLNEVFTDPRIVKVLHGSMMDIVWLQRDLGLYIVGLFDTYHASWALRYPKHGLAFLLKKFVNFDAAKQYQMADWRIRPLPSEMFNYARSDTHFLLYIYDMLRNELVEGSNPSQGIDLISDVMTNSKTEALQCYERPSYDEVHGSGQMGWHGMLARWPANLTKEQFAVFRAMHKWRDQVARFEDESLNSIMPRKVLYTIARHLPNDSPALLGCSHPITKAIHKQQKDLIDIIRAARASAESQPELSDFYGDNKSESQTNRGDKVTSSSRDTEAQQTLAAVSGMSLQEPVRLKTETSMLWGPALSSFGAADPKQAYKKSQATLHLTLPLPQLASSTVQESRAVPNHAGDQVMDHSSQSDSPITEEKLSSEIITLRQSSASKKRKLENVAGLDMETNGGTFASGTDSNRELSKSIDQEHDDTKRRKIESRKERKAKKRLQKQESSTGFNTSGQTSNTETKPFDYANAPSVLHPSKANEKSQRPVKSANPYAKSLDAPKGLPRTQKEQAGKSMTYRK